jgi:hypothetical protein
MAFCTVVVHGHAVERGEHVLGVARRTSRRTGRPARTMGAMARIAATFHVQMRPPFLVRVARNALIRLGKEGPRVGLVAACAGLVPLGCRSLFLGVATSASERHRGFMRGRSVARCAFLVAGVRRDQRGLARVASHAKAGSGRGREVVGLMATHAWRASSVPGGVGGRDGLVTARTSVDLRRGIRGMRLVARRARCLASVVDLDVCVTAATRFCGELRRVWHVAGEA